MSGRRVALNAAALAGGGVVAQICFVAIEILIARFLGQSSYGAYGTVYAIALSIAVIADMGMTWKLIEDGSRDARAIPGLLGTTLVLKLLFCSAIYPIAFLLLPSAGYGPEITGLFAVFFVYAAMLVVQETLAGVYAAHQRMHVSAFFQATAPLTILLGVVLVIWLSPTLPAIGWAYVLGAASTTGVWAWVTFLSERPYVRLRESLTILRGSYLYGISAILYQVSLGIELILLSLLRDFAEVGLFAAADKFSALGSKVGVMASRVLSPLLFAQSEHEPQTYRRTCKTLIRAVSVFGTFGCLVLALLAEPLLGLAFGGPFRAGAVALVLLTISLYARLLAIALQMILSASGQHVRRTGSLGLSVTIAISAGLFLIPSFGIVGAALSRATADSFYVGAMLRARNLPIPRAAATGWVLGPGIVGALAYLASLGLELPLVLDVSVALLAYFGGLLAIRLVDMREVRELARIVRATARF